MRAVTMALALVLGTAATAPAQNPQRQPPVNAQRPFAGPGFGLQQQRRNQLRTEIQQRFAQQVQTQLGLTDDQMTHLRDAEQSSQGRRQQINEQERDLRQAVAQQLTPGVAANQDSLSKLLGAIAAVHVARAQEEQQELHDLGQFLTPVQTARLLIMRQQLMQRIQAIREGRFRPGQGMMPPNPDDPQPDTPDPGAR